jgi:hypothetical protein
VKNDYFMILFCVVLLMGCSPASTPANAPVQPTQTLSAMATPTRRVDTPTSASTPSPSPDRSATEFAATSTANVQAVMTAQQPREYGSYTSPDGELRATVVIYDCIKVVQDADAASNSLEQLKVLEISSGEEHVPDSQIRYCDGLGAFGLEGLFWSPNSRYFYYTNAREGFPDGCPGNWERPVRRMETGTFEVEELGSGPLSPNRTKLATWQGNKLVLWEVNDGVEMSRLSPPVLNTEMGAGGPIVWSPDSQALIYVKSGSYCQPSTKSSVVHLDLQTLEQKILLESESPRFVGASWEKLDKLTLFDENKDSWVYSFDTQKLEKRP